jgi:hypothetical protein
MTTSAKLHLNLTPFIVASICVFAGIAGWKLVPDTQLYARHGLHLRPYPLASFPGAIAGLPGVILVSSVAAGICVYLLPAGRSRAIFLVLSGWYLLYPGMDAVGTAFILYMDRRNARWPILPVLLIHPVAALTTWPRLVSQYKYWLLAVLALSIAAVVYVGQVDTYDTTYRYFIPFFGLVAARLKAGNQ